MAIQSALPDKIGPFRVVRRLGQGGMGVVFEGVHEEIERRVAIKLLKSEFARDREVARRFFNEARAVNRVGHPGIVQVSEFGHQPDGTAYLVMEYLEGKTLRQLQLDHNGALPLFETTQLARQIAAALNAAHQKGIIHRDLKPENVMLVADDAVPGGLRAKLLDFGLAKVLTQAAVTLSKTPDHHIMGTPIYMSPEQCQSAAQVDEKADVYSFGVMLYESSACCISVEKPMGKGRRKPPGNGCVISAAPDLGSQGAVNRQRVMGWMTSAVTYR